MNERIANFKYLQVRYDDNFEPYLSYWMIKLTLREKYYIFIFLDNALSILEYNK